MIPRWWQRLIDPEALRALGILVLAAIVVLIARGYRLTIEFHRWKRPAFAWLPGPWPLYVSIGFVSANVLRDP